MNSFFLIVVFGYHTNADLGVWHGQGQNSRSLSNLNINHTVLLLLSTCETKWIIKKTIQFNFDHAAANLILLR
jgi:hypothetical protein